MFISYSSRLIVEYTYKKHLPGVKWKNAVTIDEAWVYLRKKHSSNIVKVKSFMVKENPPIQRTVPKSLNFSGSTVTKYINNYLNFKKIK